ncbi:MAG: class I SAM-dependent methyltransferase [Patescibacteria group bacterium]
MKVATAKKLLALVKNNYQEIAVNFNTTRRKEIWPEIRAVAAPVKDNDRILDLGCGNGRLLEALKDKKIDYLGLDSSAALIELARQNYPNYKFLVGDILDLADIFKEPSRSSINPIGINKFDYVFCLAVLQHIPGGELRLQVLKLMKEALSARGKIMISVWNLWSPVWKSKHYRGMIFRNYLFKIIGFQDLDFGDLVFPWKNIQGGIISERYYHAFTARELRNLAIKAGFRNIELTKDNFNYWLTLS